MARWKAWPDWRDPRLTYKELVGIGVAVLVPFLAAGVAIWHLWPYSNVLSRAAFVYAEQGPAQGESWLREYLVEHPGDRDAWFLLVRERGARTTQPDESLDNDAFLEFLEKSTGPSPAALRAWYDYAAFGLEAGLAALDAIRDPGERLRTRASFQRESAMLEEALATCDEEIALGPDAREARREAIEILVDLRRYAEASERLEDPDNSRAADPRTAVEVFEVRGEYARMLLPLVRTEFEALRRPLVAAVLGVGGVWLVLCLVLGWAWTWPFSGRLLALAAVILGFLSGTAVLFVIAIQDRWMIEPESPESTILSNLLYSILGIGLREELVKALFLAPLLPYLARSRNHLEILCLSSLVGLGFAVNENLNYYIGSGGKDILGRFLTANFAHMVMTGYAGYWLAVATRRRTRAAWKDFASVFSQMVVAHGLYDFVLIEPAVHEYSFLAFVIFILLSHVYLQQVAEGAPRTRRPVPILRLFVAGLAIVVGVGFCVMSSRVGPWKGFDLTVRELLGVALIAIMFFREIGETVSA